MRDKAHDKGEKANEKLGAMVLRCIGFMHRYSGLAVNPAFDFNLTQIGTLMSKLMLAARTAKSTSMMVDNSPDLFGM